MTEEALYDSAVACFRIKNYDRSESLFLKIMAEFPSSDYAQRAAYMNGYLYTVGDNSKKNYAAAKERFALFVKTYPKSRYTSDTRSWIAVIDELEQARRRQGRFVRFLSCYQQTTSGRKPVTEFHD